MITVVGSANLDLVVSVDRHPATGETVLGGDTSRFPGGKGANQAVSAARLGGDTSFVGCIGEDAAGETLTRSLADAGIDLGSMERSSRPSGLAFITVDSDGDNAIVVSPGANDALLPEHVTTDAVRDADIVLLQLEVPMATVAAAAAHASGVVILDPAPARPLPAELLDTIDVLVPNETELAMLAGVDPDGPIDDLATAARTLGPPTVIVTLGARGALIVTADSATLISAPTVAPVDTTAAGDAFRGALAVGLDAGRPLEEVVTAAVRVGAATTMVAGAQPALPSWSDVDERIGTT